MSQAPRPLSPSEISRDFADSGANARRIRELSVLAFQRGCVSEPRAWPGPHPGLQAVAACCTVDLASPPGLQPKALGLAPANPRPLSYRSLLFTLQPQPPFAPQTKVTATTRAVPRMIFFFRFIFI